MKVIINEELLGSETKIEIEKDKLMEIIYDVFAYYLGPDEWEKAEEEFIKLWNQRIKEKT